MNNPSMRPMCQLVAYVGDRPIAPLLPKSLELQEPIFGAQATGLGVINESGLYTEKDYGQVKRVMKTTEISSLQGTAGIAHSRYNLTAKDDPRYNTKEMPHPFLNDDETLALMHNGGIINYKEHWDRLKDTRVFRSHSLEVDAITDTEVAVHMLSDSLGNGLCMEEALREGDSALFGRSISDNLVEPRRAEMIPNFWNVNKAALDSGASGCSIAGGGPSVFVVGGDTSQVGKAMAEAFEEAGVVSEIYKTRPSSLGTRVI